MYELKIYRNMVKRRSRRMTAKILPIPFRNSFQFSKTSFNPTQKHRSSIRCRLIFSLIPLNSVQRVSNPPYTYVLDVRVMSNVENFNFHRRSKPAILNLEIRTGTRNAIDRKTFQISETLRYKHGHRIDGNIHQSLQRSERLRQI